MRNTRNYQLFQERDAYVTRQNGGLKEAGLKLLECSKECSRKEVSNEWKGLEYSRRIQAQKRSKENGGNGGKFEIGSAKSRLRESNK